MKKLHHHTCWLDEDLHLYLVGIELQEQARTGEDVGMSRIIRSIIREHRDRCKMPETQCAQASCANLHHYSLKEFEQ